jgi:hypothetical protein
MLNTFQKVDKAQHNYSTMYHPLSQNFRTELRKVCCTASISTTYKGTEFISFNCINILCESTVYEWLNNLMLHCDHLPLDSTWKRKTVHHLTGLHTIAFICINVQYLPSVIIYYIHLMSSLHNQKDQYNKPPENINLKDEYRLCKISDHPSSFSFLLIPNCMSQNNG